MKSKYEIVLQETTNVIFNEHDFIFTGLSKAMDEWSNQENKELKDIVIQLQKDFVLKLETHVKQECIDYSKWIWETGFTELTAYVPMWAKDGIEYDYNTLYDLYLQSKQ